MNERIRELAERASDTSEYDLECVTDKFLEDFAELIVRECIDLSIKEKFVETHYDAPELEKILKKHFGVMELLPIPNEWFTDKASTCFAKSYNGEGSYYCPVCGGNSGSVWYNNDWRPTKYQALCYECRPKYEGIDDE